ncbi:hypothetical protein [Aquisphaera insulae]|uniref:hypothetical protein n=1 Tax=Aquisphaera insulae TaxID=2712864 RepID=UPI0013EC2489|nr:hypothetical protein [Aquisphaera insulae]
MRRLHPRTLMATVMALALSLGPAAQADDDEPKPRPKAPGDAQIVGSDRAGAYFVSKALKERYDQVVGQIEGLRQDIVATRISAAEGRSRVEELSTKLRELRSEIEKSRVYIPGADLVEGKATTAFPIAADGFLLIDAPNVELRGWDRPEVRCIVEKSVLTRDGKGIDEDLAGIRVEHRRATGKELFGFYRDIAGKPEWKADWERFRFKDYLDREFEHVKLTGLSGQEGNRMITVEAKNEEGAGQVSGQWRRQARLVVFVPRCKSVGVRGGLAGFRAKGVHAALTVVGEGDRDYNTTYAVSEQDGPLVAENIAIGRIESVRGDVSVSATAYSENVSTVHDARGLTVQPPPMQPAEYREIDGGLRVRLVRGDLTVGRVSGRVDVENDFGRTSWLVAAPLARVDHRVVSQSGDIELRLDPAAFAGLPLACFSECGVVQLADGAMKGKGPGEAVHSLSFTSSAGFDALRAWRGLATQVNSHGSLFLADRIAAALRGSSREPGVDVLNRAGSIRLLPARP